MATKHSQQLNQNVTNTGFPTRRAHPVNFRTGTGRTERYGSTRNKGGGSTSWIPRGSSAKGGRATTGFHDKRSFAKNHYLGANATYPRGRSAPATLTGMMLDGTETFDDPYSTIGGMGGRFSSSSRFKTIRLPSIRPFGSELHRGVRVQSVYSKRWVVVPPEGEIEEIDMNSSLTLEAAPTDAAAAQTENMQRSYDQNESASMLRSKAQVAAPADEQANYLLMGKHMIAHSRRDMDEQELIRLERMGLQPAPELYYGRGFSAEPRAVRLRQLRKRALSDDQENLHHGTHRLATDPAPGEPESQLTSPEPNDAGDPGAAASPGEAVEGAAPAGAPAGAEAEVPSTRRDYSEFLIKNSDSKPAMMNVRNYQIRELHGAMDEDGMGAHSAAFMLLDGEGGGEIPTPALVSHLKKAIDVQKPDATAAVQTMDTVSALVINDDPAHASTLREFIAIMAFAGRLIPLPEVLIVKPEQRELAAEFTEGFFQCDEAKVGHVDRAAVVAVVAKVLAVPVDAGSALETLINELPTKPDSSDITYIDFLCAVPSLLATIGA